MVALPLVNALSVQFVSLITVLSELTCVVMERILTA